jgi:UDP-sulfoquinovose synthase
MKILILGGDGFCGWPTALHLSAGGHDVTIVDNLIRRKTDIDLGNNSLTPISPLQVRLSAWQEISGKTIDFIALDIAQDYYRFVSVLCTLKPDVIVHFAEQRSAPYSMMSERSKRHTVNNNLQATHNVLCAVVESELDIHLVHLGSIGVYGYKTANMEIPEGYLQVTPHGSAIQKEILYPVDPDSIYHMTKSQDQLFFFYYNKNNRLRITDLHQGIVWGTQTTETSRDQRLINRFDYDGIYGTVLNRFLVQGTIGYPLTVYGSGGQTRAFIHIQNTVQCIELAILNPPQLGERVQILNQVAQTYSVIDLAKLISSMTGTEVNHLPNPRVEPAENEFIVSNDCFLEMGLKLILLQEGLLREVQDIVLKYKERCDQHKILISAEWRKG